MIDANNNAGMEYALKDAELNSKNCFKWSKNEKSNHMIAQVSADSYKIWRIHAYYTEWKWKFNLFSCKLKMAKIGKM